MVYIRYFGAALRAGILVLIMFLALDTSLAVAKCPTEILDKLLKQGFSKEEILQVCGDNSQDNPQISPDNNVQSQSTSSGPDIDWGNLQEYFEVRNIEFKKGFKEARSELSFLVKSKGDFFGTAIAYYYDPDEVKICNSPIGYNYCDDFGYDDDVFFKTSGGSRYYWQEGDSDRARIYLPNDVATIEFKFIQDDY